MQDFIQSKDHHSAIAALIHREPVDEVIKRGVYIFLTLSGWQDEVSISQSSVHINLPIALENTQYNNLPLSDIPKKLVFYIQCSTSITDYSY